MKALVKKKAEKGIWLEDVPEPEMGINDVKIRVLKTGICGTDLHIYDWDAWASKTIPQGLVIGHEFVGEVVAFGSNVADVAIGQLVSGEGMSFADGAGTVSPDGAISVHIRWALALTGTVRSQSTSYCQCRTSGTTARACRMTLRRSSTRSAMQCIRLWRFQCWARTCW